MLDFLLVCTFYAVILIVVLVIIAVSAHRS